MELISQRIARGEDIRPPRRKPVKKSKRSTDVSSEAGMSTTSLADSVKPMDADNDSVSGRGSPTRRGGDIDWRKWGERAVSLRILADRGKRWASRSRVREDDYRFFKDAHAKFQVNIEDEARPTSPLYSQAASGASADDPNTCS